MGGGSEGAEEVVWLLRRDDALFCGDEVEGVVESIGSWGWKRVRNKGYYHEEEATCTKVQI
jgi:hypothetical protein